MGYYTDYELNVYTLDDSEIPKAVLDDLTQTLTAFEVCGYALLDDYSQTRNIVTYWGKDAVKWYDHDDDMLEISRLYPNLMFELHGAGESADDVWYTNYKNGVSQYRPGELVFPPLDESLFADATPAVDVLF